MMRKLTTYLCLTLASLLMITANPIIPVAQASIIGSYYWYHSPSPEHSDVVGNEVEFEFWYGPYSLANEIIGG